MMALRGRGRSLVVMAATVLAALSSLASPADAAPSAAQRLVDTYSPIVMTRAQRDPPCDSSEEQYGPPTSVDAVLGNPRVRLLEHDARGTQVIKRVPTAADLAGLGSTYYLDLPGSPLEPGCKYARDFAALRRAGHTPAVTYAHIAREPGHSGLAVQYWFYYYFNQFNDLHESDWEGMQIAFSADTATGALSTGPDEIVLFQHSGGEHADWTDSKVQKEGTHPVVYSAAGSHATFYDSALWLGNGQNGSGVGCDNTTGPLSTYRPRPILLPDVPVSRGEFAWLSYTGRWGQREAGFNNGPAGPNTKTVWREPFTWMDGTRSASPRVPGGSLIGPSVGNAFCGAVANVSSFLNLAAKTGPGAIAVGLVILLLILVPVLLTRWRPVQPQPLRQARALGQLLLTAGRVYWRHAATLLLIAVVSLLIIGAFDGLEWLVRRAAGASGSGVRFSDSGSGVGISTSDGIGRTIATPIASAAVIAFVRNLERQQDQGFTAAWSAVLHRLWRLVAVQIVILVLLVLIAITIIGIPYAIKKFVDWQFAQQEILYEDRSIREALRGSSRLVHGHWWHTAVVAGTLWVLSQIPGPVLGFALLFTTLPVSTVNLFGSVVFAVLLPYIGIGRTLLYLDLAAREVSAAAPASMVVAPAATG
jgi:Vacuolar protein sorting-associated protein 62